MSSDGRIEQGDRVMVSGMAGAPYNPSTWGVHRAHVTHVWGLAGFDASTGLAHWGLSVADEGVRWIRGDHAVDSPECRALLAATLLAF